MKKKFYLFVSLSVVFAFVLLNLSSASAQTITKTTPTGSQPTNVIKLSDIVAASQNQANPATVQVPAITVTGNTDSDNAAYKTVITQWMKDHTADYLKLDAKTRAVWEAGDFNYFAQFEILNGNYINSEHK